MIVSETQNASATMRNARLSIGGGLNRFNSETETFTHYREQDGLANDIVLDILEDDRGTLWIATANGLSRFDPHTETFKSYGASDGLPINEFSAAHKSDTGELFFGGIKGFMSFYPDRMEDNPHVPPVALTSLQQNGLEVKVGQAPEDLKIVALVLAGSVFGGYRLRVRSLEVRGRELERRVEQEMEQRMQVEEALRESEMERAVVAERSRLARELHL
jgi:ligand-binding sensor domain-containing protein